MPITRASRSKSPANRGRPMAGKKMANPRGRKPSNGAAIAEAVREILVDAAPMPGPPPPKAPSWLDCVKDAFFKASPGAVAVSVIMNALPDLKNEKIKDGKMWFHQAIIWGLMLVYLVLVNNYALVEVQDKCVSGGGFNFEECFVCDKKTVTGYVSYMGLLPLAMGLLHSCIVYLFKYPIPCMLITNMGLYFSFLKVIYSISPYIIVYPHVAVQWKFPCDIKNIPTKSNNLLLFLVDPSVFMACLSALLLQKIWELVKPFAETAAGVIFRTFMKLYNDTMH